MLSFKEFVESRTKVTDKKVLYEEFDRDHPIMVYEGRCHIDIVNSEANGRYELIMENDSFCSNSLEELEHTLYYHWYVPQLTTHQELIEFVTERMLELQANQEGVLADHNIRVKALYRVNRELRDKVQEYEGKLEKINQILISVE